MNVPAEVVVPAIGAVLETMYFREPFYCGSGCVKEPLVGTSIAFSGAVEGVFRMFVSRGLAAQLAVDFLADDRPDPGGRQVEAMVMELANIACGAAIGAWMPAFDVHFSVPKMLASGSDRVESSHCFSVDGENPGIAIDIALTGLS